MAVTDKQQDIWATQCREAWSSVWNKIDKEVISVLEKCQFTVPNTFCNDVQRGKWWQCVREQLQSLLGSLSQRLHAPVSRAQVFLHQLAPEEERSDWLTACAVWLLDRLGPDKRIWNVEGLRENMFAPLLCRNSYQAGSIPLGESWAVFTDYNDVFFRDDDLQEISSYFFFYVLLRLSEDEDGKLQQFLRELPRAASESDTTLAHLMLQFPAALPAFKDDLGNFFDSPPDVCSARGKEILDGKAGGVVGLLRRNFPRRMSLSRLLFLLKVLPVPPFFTAAVTSELGDAIGHVSVEVPQGHGGAIPGIECASFKVLREAFLAPALRACGEVLARRKNWTSLAEDFGKRFLRLADRQTGQRKPDDCLDSFLTFARRGSMDSERLALKTVCDAWNRQYPNVLPLDALFTRFRDAERLLFWLEHYRDHTVHTLKVYILGRIILQAMMANLTAKANPFSAEALLGTEAAGCSAVNPPPEDAALFAWTAASHFHDFSLPVEHLEPIVTSLVSEFTKTEIEELPATVVSQAGFAEWFARQDMQGVLFGLVHRLVAYTELGTIPSFPGAEKQNPTPIWANTLRVSERHVRQVFVDLLRKGDHGVVSALTYLLHVFPNLQLADEKTDFAHARKDWRRNLHLHSKIAEAILLHQVVFQATYRPPVARGLDRLPDGSVVLGPERPVYTLPQPYAIRLSENPIAFLLALCDLLQDWGRTETRLGRRAGAELDSRAATSTRPYAYLEGQPTWSLAGDDRPELDLSVSYRWLVRGNELERVGTHQCPYAREPARWQGMPDACCKEFTERKDHEDRSCVGSNGNWRGCNRFWEAYAYLRNNLEQRLDIGSTKVRVTVNVRYKPSGTHDSRTAKLKGKPSPIPPIELGKEAY
jgi:hypothetical protein